MTSVPEEPDATAPEPEPGPRVSGLHRLRLDALRQELVNRARDIMTQDHQLHRLLDAVVSVTSEQTLPDTLRRITELAAELSDARFAAFGVIGPDRKVESPPVREGHRPAGPGSPRPGPDRHREIAHHAILHRA